MNGIWPIKILLQQYS